MKSFIYKDYIVQQSSMGWIAINQDCKALKTKNGNDCNCNISKKIKDEISTLYKLSRI